MTNHHLCRLFLIRQVLSEVMSIAFARCIDRVARAQDSMQERKTQCKSTRLNAMQRYDESFHESEEWHVGTPARALLLPLGSLWQLNQLVVLLRPVERGKFPCFMFDGFSGAAGRHAPECLIGRALASNPDDSRELQVATTCT
jgi:hypothetical protein